MAGFFAALGSSGPLLVPHFFELSGTNAEEPSLCPPKSLVTVALVSFCVFATPVSYSRAFDTLWRALLLFRLFCAGWPLPPTHVLDTTHPPSEQTTTAPRSTPTPAIPTAPSASHASTSLFLHIKTPEGAPKQRPAPNATQAPSAPTPLPLPAPAIANRPPLLETLTDLRAGSHLFDEQLAGLRASIATREREHTRVCAVVRALSDKNAALVRERNALKEERDKARRAAEAATRETGMLVQDKSILVHKTAELERALSARTTRGDDAAVLVERLQRECAAIRATFKFLITELSRSRRHRRLAFDDALGHG
ncbi:uncharacterized protein BXZ73DRAFT_105422 [Epithele typhae]|uniref:uncharacterized protein n=1 Tax=Epithele typhae TaxID=378194 RepID=UPI002008A913|nr:uncharacterized protein BXZ73DRAFT_105422 [Epithele typhae]KAH9917902.1 hypothetical protein BXZ73DRAFT_105422 [Epithele typhae]